MMKELAEQCTTTCDTDPAHLHQWCGVCERLVIRQGELLRVLITLCERLLFVYDGVSTSVRSAGASNLHGGTVRAKPSPASSELPEGRVKPQPAERVRAYAEMIPRIRQVVIENTGAEAAIAVISKGDENLLRIGGRRTYHFPKGKDGQYTGFHPANDREAIAHLEELRREGVKYLLIPSTALWWLDHYAGFRHHLEEHYTAVFRQEDTCVLFALGEAAAHSHSGERELCRPHNDSLVQQVRALVKHLLPRDAVVAVATEGNSELLKLDTRPAWHFPQTGTGEFVGTDGPTAIANLEALRDQGAAYLVVPKTAFWRLEQDREFRQFLEDHTRLVVWQRHVCSIFCLTEAPTATAPTPQTSCRGSRWCS
jgi:hypothetical protein